MWGRPERLTPRAAALVNGVSSHACEVDDTGGCDHSGAVVVPATLAAAQLSLPYALAAVLAHGHAGLDAYADGRRTGAAARVAMDRVELQVDDAMPPQDEPVVTVTRTDGRRRSLRVTEPSGSPGNPLGEAAVRDKFHGLARRSLTPERARELEGAVFGLPDASDARGLGALLVP